VSRLLLDAAPARLLRRRGGLRLGQGPHRFEIP
jgi:hypothetical protein